jgi:3-oxo-5-alpha-steroid 4-dehydrogenase 1
MGSYLSSPAAEKHLTGAFERPLFWFGVTLWAFGFAGNILHDEILLNLRRKTTKRRESSKDNANTNASDKSETINGDASQPKESGGQKQHHYAIPHGYLYKYISYPNYFCEWVEWAGFALAASPFPFCFSSAGPAVSAAFPGVVSVLPKWSLTSLTSPWLFFYMEVFLMLPRAVKGHAWYHDKFPDYPKERKVVVPFLL